MNPPQAGAHAGCAICPIPVLPVHPRLRYFLYLCNLLIKYSFLCIYLHSYAIVTAQRTSLLRLRLADNQENQLATDEHR